MLFEQVGNFSNGVKDSIDGLVSELYHSGEGLVYVVLNAAELSLGLLYGVITGERYK